MSKVHQIGQSGKHGFKNMNAILLDDGECLTLDSSCHPPMVVVEEQYLKVKCNRKEGYIKAYDGDSVGITFAKSGNAHTLVTHGEARTITTMCDHDIGVIVKDDRSAYGNRKKEVK